jgi:hypothetical protein
MGIMFIDFEASSLNRGSVPIEIAWVDEDGQADSCLIKPEAGWDDWSVASESIHGISRGDIARDGEEARLAAKRAFKALGAADAVYSDQPVFDQAWLEVLLATAGFPFRSIMLCDVVEAYGAQSMPLRTIYSDPADVVANAARIIAEAEHAEAARHRRRHRATEDATGLWWTWKEVGRRVMREIGQV